MPQEYAVRWSGGRIGAGTSVFHFQSIAGGTAAQGLANATKALFEALKTVIPDDVVVTYDSEVRELANDGTLLGAYAVTPPANSSFTNANSWLNGAGIVVRHNTGVVLGGRRVMGRTFIVPAASSMFTASGDVASTTLTLINGAFATFLGATVTSGATFSVWSRANSATVPVSGSATQVRPSTLKTRNDRV